jgi:hypothetical protein
VQPRVINVREAVMLPNPFPIVARLCDSHPPRLSNDAPFRVT